jgi:hypothetical protein
MIIIKGKGERRGKKGEGDIRIASSVVVFATVLKWGDVGRRKKGEEERETATHYESTRGKEMGVGRQGTVGFINAACPFFYWGG